MIPSEESFRLIVSIGILWIILNIKMMKQAIVEAIRELKREVEE